MKRRHGGGGGGEDRLPPGAGAAAGDEEAVVPMDSIGLAYRRLADNRRVGGAVKAGAQFLDAGASQVGAAGRLGCWMSRGSG